MNEYVSLDTYKYFIDAYFNMSYRWNDLEMTINDFFELEKKEEVEKLLEEVNIIKKIDDWEYLRKINIETAEIYYDEARNKEFIQIVIDVLSKKLKD
ncbi:hypothetical protein [Paenibacillus elgii]|uniref:hypothetical protein n=1 Tax=Paenibacillus elgii TaxID=189691 RepID=UPI000248BFDE|nr:hypothetical protein [Paenibacillus elgii]